jgi:hypothetical protein
MAARCPIRLALDGDGVAVAVKDVSNLVTVVGGQALCMEEESKGCRKT